MTAKIVSFEDMKARREERDVHRRWIEFYNGQTHDELLEALVFEHDHDFPLRSSPEKMDQLRHRALVDVLSERAQTEFLKSFLDEIRRNGTGHLLGHH